MYFEDFTLRRGDTVASIAVAYGHKASDARSIWDRHENIGLRGKRARHEDAQPGDLIMIPIPWVTTTRINTVRLATAARAGGSTMIMHRDGARGSFLAFVQTVNQDNMPIGTTARFCVDGCPADDDRPFYWTQAELTALPDRRRQFDDAASRNPPTAAQGAVTQWRAILSIAVVNKMRVTILEPTFWGFNITQATAGAPNGVITAVGPRNSTVAEIKGHLNLLRNGIGTGGTTFGRHGWTFREEPRLIGDFPTPSREVMYA